MTMQQLSEDAAKARASRVAHFEQQVQIIAQQHGLDWNTMTDDQRELLIDDLVHEARMRVTEQPIWQ